MARRGRRACKGRREDVDGANEVEGQQASGNKRGSTLELWTTSWAAVRTRTESDHNPALLHIAHILGDAPNLSREHQRRSVD